MTEIHQMAAIDPTVTIPGARQAGFSLIEILVSLVIIMLGLLGLIGLQAHASIAEFESYQRSQALLILNDMVDRINGNRYSAGCYAITDSSTGVSYLGTSGGGHFGTPSCASGFKDAAGKLRAETDLTEWDLMLQGVGEQKGGASVGVMVGARGCISVDAVNHTYTIAVAWQGNIDTITPSNKCGQNLYGTEGKRRVVSTTVRIPNLGG